MATRISRRRFLGTTGGAVALAWAGGGCASRAAGFDPRLTARPRDGVTTSLTSGALGLGSGRDGVVQMPSTVPAGKLPVLVFLHGATQNGAAMLRRLEPMADDLGVVVVAPDSRNGTWDAIRDQFDEDVTFLNRVLEFVFARVDVDPSRLTLGGFSDGASYALSLGLANGDLFPQIVACSPGFVISTPTHGRPRIFDSHGTADQILPIDQCSNVIVPRLLSMGYDVTFRRFDGRHEVPPAIATEALRWLNHR